MKHSEFEIGKVFRSAERLYLCTDIGTRTINAIRVDSVRVAGTTPELHRVLTRDEAAADGWFNGPPYVVAEIVFDEDDQINCYAD